MEGRAGQKESERDMGVLKSFTAAFRLAAALFLVAAAAALPARAQATGGGQYSMQEIIDNDYNLNISRYVSTAEAEKEIDLAVVHADLMKIEAELAEAKARHNVFLAELGLAALP